MCIPSIPPPNNLFSYPISVVGYRILINLHGAMICFDIRPDNFIKYS